MAKKKLTTSKLFIQVLKTLSFIPLSICLPAQAAVNGTWVSNAGTNWNVGANWSSNPTVPGTNPADIANVGTGSASTLTINPVDPAFILDTLNFNSATSLNYVVLNNGNLTLAGVGITNTTSPAVTATISNGATLDFINGASALPGNTINITNFVTGTVNFQNLSSAGGANIINGGILNFKDASLAGTAEITNSGGTLNFQSSSSAMSAVMNNTNSTSVLNFKDASSAGTATINNNAGSVIFQGVPSGTSASINNGADSHIDISGTALGVSVGSINETLAGTGDIKLGTKTLTVGSLNLANSIYNVIQGAGGGLTKVGTNILTLLGNNTYTGITTISVGTLQLGNGGGTGSVVGDIVDNAMLIFNRSDASIYAGNISGTGSVNNQGVGGGSLTTLSGTLSGGLSLTQSGTGRTILIGTNTYTGGTTISGGTLQLGNGGASGTVAGNILDNGALVFNYNVAIGYAGVISGTGSVRQSGVQTLVLTGDNTYTGMTTIDPGTFLQLGNNGATGSITGDATLGSLGGLIFYRSNNLTYAGNMSGAGDVQKVASGTTTLTGTNTYTGGTKIIAGTLQLGNGGATGSVVGNILDSSALIVNRSNAYIYNDVISGVGTLTKLGTGSLTLNGINTYTGDTTINNGRLLLGDITHPTAKIGGSVIVNTGGTLLGYGTIGQNLTNGGTVLPGGSIGTLTINGNYTQLPTGSYIVDVDQAGNSDLLNITGIGSTASLNGTVGVNTLDNGFLANYPYTILQTANPTGVSGTFSNTDINGIFSQGFLQGVVSYLSLILIGVGKATIKGKIIDAKAALASVGLKPLTLAPKEGLALINGTQVSTALALSAFFTTEMIFKSAVVTGSLSIDAAAASDAPFRAEIQTVRGHAGQIHVANDYRTLLANSEIRNAHQNCERVQDPYSLRCQPQVMGACFDQLTFVEKTLLTEANAVSDNPLVFSDQKEILSGGNFHAEPVAMASDNLALVISEIGALSERRIALLTDPQFSGLPAFLVNEPGINSGFMLPHVTAASLASENKTLAHPACVDSLPTSANQEDHVSMATFAARRLHEMNENTLPIIAIEWLAAAQGIDLRRPLKTSPLLEQAIQYLREKVPFYEKDRYFAPDIEAAIELVREEKLSGLVKRRG